ncbi:MULTISPECIES: M23 family metallopeptidase [unclassified Bacillus (in: firmicutes)]|uniref:M23 family metallopeptidase n=1 Tax=unclassified Bacillus (in: firmicutes) TaxID=185979 RepID=UPI0008E40A05|nr:MULTISPECIES: M23 family metallopeptidase [unclassified Bacillus (in: firmicutes)]SFB04115.1 stage II sporulation protein Q [Bacillus sp. UNCCL13]SFQ88588.1 stage II sporulation protein Q [Bacillus sp. cl95]
MREEENKRSSQNSSFKRFFQKRWVFPAVYIASAAIILTGLLWYQSSGNVNEKSKMYDYNATDVPGKGFNQPSLEVNRALENFKMPVTNADAVVQKQFYDFEGKKEQQEAALVFYNNTYHPNTGIDIALKSGEAFDVVAAMSGTVTKVEEDSLLGNVIEIEHDKGIVTQYQSVKDIKVEVGDEVKQGQALAKAGQSLFNEKAGVHVHFEIRKDNVAVNPIDYFEKSLSALQEAKIPAAGKKQESSEDGDAGKSADDSKSEDGSADDKKDSADDENPSEIKEPSDESSDSLDNENS